VTRAINWFSCGACSAVAAKLGLEKYGKQAEVIYCDTFAFEHPDNRRFFQDVREWLGVPIKILRSERYIDIYDVFDQTGWLVGPAGARCTTELKKALRMKYAKPNDIHIMGYPADEQDRITKFEGNNPGVHCDWVLRDEGITKKETLMIIRDAGIELPEMYKLGYKNNNCIGCVKGQSGYWNKIRKDFPEAFDRMAKQERKMGVAINKRYEGEKRIPVYLDELPAGAGRYEVEPDISCGAFCQAEMEL
jgi:hypothetical protein